MSTSLFHLSFGKVSSGGLNSGSYLCPFPHYQIIIHGINHGTSPLLSSVIMNVKLVKPAYILVRKRFLDFQKLRQSAGNKAITASCFNFSFARLLLSLSVQYCQNCNKQDSARMRIFLPRIWRTLLPAAHWLHWKGMEGPEGGLRLQCCPVLVLE